MFLIQTILSGDHYCVCKGAWLQFTITQIDFIEENMRVYLTPEDGLRSSLFKISRGGVKPDYLFRKDFSIGLGQHVKTEVEGGTICIVGISYEGEKRTNYSTNFAFGCPFSDFEGVAANLTHFYPQEVDKENSKAKSF